MPSVLLVKIFLCLENTRDVPRAAAVCKKWSTASKDGKIWEKLDLSRVRGKKAAVLGLTIQLCSAKSLTIKHCILPDDVLAPLSRRVPNLRTLNLSHAISERTDLVDLLLQNCPLLESLSVSNCTFINDSAVQIIATRCPRLQTLKLNRCKKVTDQALACLFMLPELRTLSVKKCTGLTDKGVKDMMKGVPKLQMLDVRGCRLTQGVAPLLKRLHKVKHDDLAEVDSANPLFSK